MKNIFFIKITKVVLVVMLCVSLSSCNDENDNYSTNNFASKKSGNELVANPNNIYDYYGEQHNEYLDLLRHAVNDYENRTGVHLSISENFDRLVRFCSDRLFEQGLDTIGVYGIVETLYRNERYDDMFFSMIDQTALSHESKNCIKDLIINMIETSIANPRSMYELYNRLIKGTENEIICSTTALPSQDIRSVLTFTSVIRHSLYYWWNTVDDHGPQYSFWSTVLWDAAGALLGSFIPAVGPVGGSMVASLAAATKDSDATITVETNDDGSKAININYGDGSGDDQSDGNAD